MKGRLAYKWGLLALVSATYFLAQGSRQIYNTVLPSIKADFAASGLDDLSLGLVGSAFTFIFGLVIPFAGTAADFLRRKRMIVVGTLLFSVGIFASGFASGLGLLLVAYGVLNAAGQSLLPPSISSLIGQFHVATRATAFSIYQVVFYAGIVVCSCVSGWLSGLGTGGWRRAFWIFGATGLGWALALAVLLRDTPHPAAPSADGDKPSKNGDRPSVREALWAFFGQPAALLLTLGLGFCLYATYGFRLWIPTFLLRTFPGLTPAGAAFHAVFWYYVGAMAGVLLAGRLSDCLMPRRPAVRLETNVVGLLLMVPFLLLTAFAGSVPVVCAAIFCFGVAAGVYDSNLYAALLDVVSPRYRAAAVGFFGCGGNVLGALGPGLLGGLNGLFGMRASLASLALFALAGALVILLARKSFTRLRKEQET